MIALTNRKKISALRAPEKGLMPAVIEYWRTDFISDQLNNENRFRALTVIDTFNPVSMPDKYSRNDSFHRWFSM